MHALCLRAAHFRRSIQGAAGLNGGPPFNIASSSRAAVARLDVLASNPFFVCWAGHHRSLGVVAAITLVFFVAGLPLLTLWWLLKDPWVRSESRAANDATPMLIDSSVGNDAATHNVFIRVDNPMGIERGGGAASAALHSAHAAERLTASLVLPDPLLGVFFYDYKPTAWYTKLVDLALLLLLSLYRALLPRPATLGSIVAKAGTLCAALLVACVHVLWTRPYLDADAWMGWVSTASSRLK